jgi:serine/threonine-protein kinase RsbW
MRQPLNGPDPMGRKDRPTVELRIPAVPEWVGVARLAAAGIGSRIGLSIEDIEDLKLAVAEACTCCIQNAGAGDVRIGATFAEDQITFSVERAGAGGSARSGPASTGGESELGGLGVFLIRALMDDVTYVSDPASGTKLTLTKTLRK